MRYFVEQSFIRSREQVIARLASSSAEKLRNEPPNVTVYLPLHCFKWFSF